MKIILLLIDILPFSTSLYLNNIINIIFIIILEVHAFERDGFHDKGVHIF